MPWDDLHESKEPEDRFKNRGGQGGGGQGGGPPRPPFEIPQIKAVSYTHLTLPTICSV